MQYLSFNRGTLNAAISLLVIALNIVLVFVAIGALLSIVGVL